MKKKWSAFLLALKPPILNSQTLFLLTRPKMTGENNFKITILADEPWRPLCSPESSWEDLSRILQHIFYPRYSWGPTRSLHPRPNYSNDRWTFSGKEHSLQRGRNACAADVKLRGRLASALLCWPTASSEGVKRSQSVPLTFTGQWRNNGRGR